MKFDKEFLQRLASEDFDPDEAEIISDEIYDTSRWSELHEVVFKVGGKFYRTNYSTGLTEQQDESPYEYDDYEIECVEVVPKEVMTTIYVVKEEK